MNGVEVCNETSVVVYACQGQLVKLSGLKLHIHQGSLPDNIYQCTFFIKASLAGEYEIPENTSLVSALYWVRCEPECIFTKPITVEIDYDCKRTEQNLSRLKIVRAVTGQKQLPYNFKPVPGGRFGGTSYFGGAVEVNSFSAGFGVIGESPVERHYFCQLYYRSKDGQPHDIHIAFSWHTAAHINASHSSG